MVDIYLEALELGYYEVTFAFEGLVDDKVWKRPSKSLLSVGELAGHVAYWEAVKFAGEGEDLAKCRVSSPLIDSRFRYYPETLETSGSDQQRAMSAKEVCAELLRVHEEAMAHFKMLSPDLAGHPPGWQAHYTYLYFSRVQCFDLLRCFQPM